MTFETDFNKYFQNKKFSQLATELKVSGSSRQAALTKLGNVKNKDKILNTMVDVFENAPIVIKRAEGDKFANTKITYDVADKIYVLSSLESPISSLVKDLGETQADGILQDPRQQVEVALFKLFSNDKNEFQALGEANPKPSSSPPPKVNPKPTPIPSPQETKPVAQNTAPTVELFAADGKPLQDNKVTITKKTGGKFYIGQQEITKGSVILQAKIKDPERATTNISNKFSVYAFTSGGSQIEKDGKNITADTENNIFFVPNASIDGQLAQEKVQIPNLSELTAGTYTLKLKYLDYQPGDRYADVSKTTDITVKVVDETAKPTTKPAQNNKPTVTVKTNTKSLTTDKPNLNITKDVLSAKDKETNDAAKLTYTLGEITGGTIWKAVNNTPEPKVKGSTFTQQDINDGKISFTWDGNTNNSVGFNFKLKDDSASPGEADVKRLNISVTPPVTKKVTQEPRQPVPQVLPLPTNTNQQQLNPQSKKPVTIPPGGSPTTTTIQSTTNQEKVSNNSNITSGKKSYDTPETIKLRELVGITGAANVPDTNYPSYKTTIAYQSMLKDKGFYKGKIDGFWGPETQAALEKWKNSQSNPSTNLVSAADKINYSVMLSKEFKVFYSENSEYRTKVEKVQEYLGVTKDGKYGDATDKAVKKFQQDNKLAVDGIWGPETTKAAMNKQDNKFEGFGT